MELQQETELVEKVKRREKYAFDCLYEEYKDRAYRTAVFMVGNEADAKDVVQESFVTVYLQIGSLKEPAAFPGWFYRILTRNAIRYARKRKKEILQQEPPETGMDYGGEREEPSSVFLRQEEGKAVRAMIDELDEKHRTVLILYYYNEFSVRQIAEITGRTEGTVKSRLHAARKILEKKLLLREGK